MIGPAIMGNGPLVRGILYSDPEVGGITLLKAGWKDPSAGAYRGARKTR